MMPDRYRELLISGHSTVIISTSMRRLTATILIVFAAVSWQLPVSIVSWTSDSERCCCREAGKCHCGCDPVDAESNPDETAAFCACDSPELPPPTSATSVQFDYLKTLAPLPSVESSVASVPRTKPIGRDRPPPDSLNIATIVLLI
jgi:hypothetical protein